MKLPFKFRVFVILLNFMATTLAQDTDTAMTSESIHEQATQARTGAMSASLVSRVFDSRRIELVRSAFHAPNLRAAFTAQLSKLEASEFKDQIILMLLAEPWIGDEDGVPIEGSQPPPVLHNICIEVLASRLPDLGFQVDDASSIARFSSLKERKKIVEAFTPLVGRALSSPSQEVQNTQAHSAITQGPPLETQPPARKTPINKKPDLPTPLASNVTAPVQQPKVTDASTPETKKKSSLGFPIVPAAILAALVVGIVIYLLRRKST